MITKVHKSVWISASVVAALVVLFNLQPLAIALATISWSPGVSDSTLMALEHTGQKELKELDQKLRVNVPKGHYLVVNSTVNEFYLYKGEQMVKKDICSTGSYVLLKKSEKEKWMFKTPKGEFRIRNKTKDPVWKKPDWAFVEEGLPVPSANPPSRFEYGVLGDYSLSLGDGYLIHGTLFQRFLGLPVTHGCIRLDDENLELVYKSLPMGSKVFIF